MAPRTLSLLGISKVMTVTSTYDHRIIQGAESGLFLARIEELLRGEDGFYERIFDDLKRAAPPGALGDRRDARASSGPRGSEEEIEKQARVLQLINAYRVRGHLVADLDPLDSTRAPHKDLDPATYGLTIWDLDREFITNGLSGKDRADAARDPRGPARDLLRHDRRRVHVHRRPRAQGVAAGAHGVGAQPHAARRRRRGAASWRSWSRRRASSASCTPSTSATSASRWRAARPLIPLLDRVLNDAARSGRARRP